MGPMHDKLSFRNADEWRALLGRIAHGICNDRWIKKLFTVASEIDGAKERQFAVYHRDRMAVMRFLIGHRHSPRV